VGSETVVAFQNRASNHKITLGAKENFVEEHMHKQSEVNFTMWFV
jgi:cupin superfamily acireductone dioxygenase involved in methionine salvage